MEVAPVAEPRMEALPGRVVTIAMRVTNRAAAARRFESSFHLPSSWRTLAREGPFDISASQTVIRLLSFSVPREAPAGEYAVRYVVRDQVAPADSADAAFVIVVLPVRQLELQLLEAPRFAVAGEPYSVVFHIANLGNSRGSVRLRPFHVGTHRVRLERGVIGLEARESRSIEVVVETDPRSSARHSHVVELAARLEEDTTVTAAASSSVEVIPRVYTVDEQFHQFPFDARFRAAGERGIYGTQVELVGAGSFAEGSRNRFELLLRAPDIQRKSILGYRDEYRVGYSGPGFELYAGDRNYTLTPLTEFGRYGFGAGGSTVLSGLTIGGFLNETRFFIPVQRQQAGFLRYAVAENSEIGVNYLRRIEARETNIYSLRGLFEPLHNNVVDLEYASGVRDGVRDLAYGGRIQGRGQRYAYEARHLRSGPQYFGYYRDVMFTTTSVNLLPFAKLRLEAYYRDERRNLSKDTTRYYAPRDRYFQAGAGYSDYISLLYRRQTIEDLLPAPKYRRVLDMIQIRSGIRFSSWSLLANADLGATDDKLLGRSSPFRRIGLNSSFRISSRQSYGISLEHSRERGLFTDETIERLSASVNAWIQIAERTSLMVSAFGSRTRAETNLTYGLIDVALDHTFSFGHRVVLRGRQTYSSPSFDGRETAYLAEYSVPLSLSVSRIKSVGQLRGRILDAESGQGIRNVLVYAGGATAVTDRNGEFFFPALTPQVHYVQVDRAGIGLNRVPSQQMPFEITVHGGREERLEIGVTRSAQVSGVILRYGFEEETLIDTAAGRLVELGGHPEVLLELTNGIEVHRRLSDSRGRFVFADMRPGRWTLHVMEGNLPPEHRFEKDRFELQLHAGGREELTLKVVPRRRRIQILQEGRVIEERSTPAPPRAVQAPLPKVEMPHRPSEPCLIWRAPDRSGYYVQVSSWSTRDRAQRAATVTGKVLGFMTTIVTVDLGDNGIVHRVMIGLFKTRREATDACLRVESLRSELP